MKISKTLVLHLALFPALLALLLPGACSHPHVEAPVTLIQKLTPVLLVDSIEACLPFWVERLGYAVTMEVPDGEQLAFVGLACGSTELMLQTKGALEAELPQLYPPGERATTFLFLEVESLEAVTKAVEGYEIVVPQRKTFYGSLELGVREPGGNLVVFAEFEQTAEKDGP